MRAREVENEICRSFRSKEIRQIRMCGERLYLFAELSDSCLHGRAVFVDGHVGAGAVVRGIRRRKLQHGDLSSGERIFACSDHLFLLRIRRQDASGVAQEHMAGVYAFGRVYSDLLFFRVFFQHLFAADRVAGAFGADAFEPQGCDFSQRDLCADDVFHRPFFQFFEH